MTSNNENKKEYIKPTIKDIKVETEDILAASSEEANKAFHEDAGIWNIFHW